MKRLTNGNIILVVELDCNRCPAPRRCGPDESGRAIYCYKRGRRRAVAYETSYHPAVAEVVVQPRRVA